MSGKEALYRMQDCVSTVIAALKGADGDTPCPFVTVLEEALKYSETVYAALDGGESRR